MNGASLPSTQSANGPDAPATNTTTTHAPGLTVGQAARQALEHYKHRDNTKGICATPVSSLIPNGVESPINAS
jgi:hypothetical protein